MSESMAVGPGVRASDTERGELDDRLVTVYAARFRHELVEPIADLPEPVPERPPAADPGRLPLAVHAVLAVAIAVALLVC